MVFNDIFQNKDVSLGENDRNPLNMKDAVNLDTQNMGIPVPVQIQARDTQYSSDGSNSGRVVRFILPDVGVYAFNRGVIIMEVAVNNANRGATAQTAIHNCVMSIFEECRLLIGTTEIERMEEAGHFQTLFYEWYGSTIINATTGVLWGIGSIGTRSAYTNNGDGVTWQPYMIPIPSRILNGCLFPTELLPQIELQLKLGDPANYIEITPAGSGTVASDLKVHVRNARILCTRLDNMDTFRATIGAKLDKAGLNCKYLDIAAKNYTVTGNAPTLDMDQKSGSVDSMLLMQRVDANVKDVHVLNRLVDTIRDNLKSWRISIGTMSWPEESRDLLEYGGQIGYYDFVKWLEKFHNFHWMEDELPIGLTLANYFGPAAAGDNRFIVAIDFEAFPGSGKMNFFSTARNKDALKIKLSYTAPPGSALEVKVWVVYWNIVNLKRSAATRIS